MDGDSVPMWIVRPSSVAKLAIAHPDFSKSLVRLVYSCALNLLTKSYLKTRKCLCHGCPILVILEVWKIYTYTISNGYIIGMLR